jgi:hypothetical protein
VTGGQLIALKATGQATKKHKPMQLTVEVCKQILGTIAYTDSSDYKEAQPLTYKQSLNTAKDSTQFVLVASTGATTQLEHSIRKVRKMSRTGIDQINTVQMPGEQIFFGPSKSGKLKVVSEPNIKSKADLEQYVQRAHQRRSLAIQKGGSTIGVITTKAPLTFQRIEELEHKYALTIGGVKIRSSNGGTVFSRWPPDLQWLDGLQQNLAEELKKRSGITDFKLVMGVIALYAVGDANNISQLQNEGDIYLVDVGPIDIADQYKASMEAIVKTSDVYYYLEKFP